MISDSDYAKLADGCLERAAGWLEGFDADEVDYAAPDGVVKLEFADGVQYVLNRQAAAHQMWYAAGARAWHYDYDEKTGTWRDDRDGHELFANVARTLSEKLGRAVPPPR
jgi:CyaY protein